MLNDSDSIGTTAYAPLTDMQIAAVLRTALNPSNRFLPINSPIRVKFLLRLILALEGVKEVAKRPYGRLLDELVHSCREILLIGLPIPQHRGSILWNLGVNLSVRFDENGIEQDLEDSINVFKDCLAIANLPIPRSVILFNLGINQAKLCDDLDPTNNINEAISTLEEYLKLYLGTLGIGGESTCH